VGTFLPPRSAVGKMTSAPVELLARLDVALWNPATTAASVEALCTAASQHRVRAVCLSTSRIALATARLEDTEVKVVALVGFPLGTAEFDAQRYEAEVAVDHGAQEIELVLPVGRLSDGAPKELLRHLRDVVEAVEERPVGITLEITRLSREEIQLAVALVQEAGAAGVITGTDWGADARVSAEDLGFLRESLGAQPFLKAVGGVRDQQVANALLTAGATRVGTSFGPELLAAAKLD